MNASMNADASAVTSLELLVLHEVSAEPFWFTRSAMEVRKGRPLRLYVP